MLDSRHEMKVICPYELAVAVKFRIMKSWHCKTCWYQAIQIFTYVHKHQQTVLHYTFLAPSLQAVRSSVLCLSSINPFIYPSTYPSSFPNFRSSNFHSLIVSLITYIFLSFFHSSFTSFFISFLPFSFPSFHCLFPSFLPSRFFLSFSFILSSFFHPSSLLSFLLSCFLHFTIPPSI